MQQQTQKRFRPSAVALGGLLAAGVAGVVFYAACLMPAAVYAADDPKDGGVASAIAIGALACAAAGICLLWSALRSSRHKT